ncbi:SlyX family protein [Alcaligenaceae bacterium]|nr:SlyX family protein [Alcaligenaceae bacterium]
MEQRFVDIELKLTSLEDTVQQLNAAVYEQRKQLDELRALCRLLLRRQEEHDGAASGGEYTAHTNERPPHY